MLDPGVASTFSNSGLHNPGRWCGRKGTAGTSTPGQYYGFVICLRYARVPSCRKSAFDNVADETPTSPTRRKVCQHSSLREDFIITHCRQLLWLHGIDDGCIEQDPRLCGVWQCPLQFIAASRLHEFFRLKYAAVDLNEAMCTNEDSLDIGVCIVATVSVSQL